jgi:Ser/Thr protein kinase RdoA (MazF antagonist)
MTIDPGTSLAVGEIIAARTGTPPRNLKLERKRFGGAEATETALLTARYRDRRDRPAMLRMVVKRLDGRPAREARVYESLVADHAPGIAPELLKAKTLGPDSAVIFLEAVRRVSAWPWRDAKTTEAVLTRLGRFHTTMRAAKVVLPEWDFDQELQAMARSTWQLLDHCRYHPEYADLVRELRRVEQLIEAMPRLRKQLLSERPFGSRPIHGDVHPGNALVRRKNGTHEPVLIDWGRARLGSPLEDVSNWLQTLRFWEAEGQRLHDTFFRRYLTAFGMERRLTDDIRAAYWMAGASNALSGALLHHLAILMDERQARSARATAYRAARDWLRVAPRACLDDVGGARAIVGIRDQASPSLAFSKHLLGDKPTRKCRKTLSPPQGGRYRRHRTCS